MPQALHATLALVALSGCAGANTASSSPPPSSPVEAPAGSGKPDAGAPKLAPPRYFDERGVASPCPPAKEACPAAPLGTPFLDRCRMSGFQVRQCGCELRCTGDVSAMGRHYDADGHPKECAASRVDCTPPQAPAAFQDACNEHGFRLDTCGCEWLCSGDFRR